MLRNSFNGGTEGTIITIANSGGISGTPPGVAPQPTTGSRWIFSAAAARSGPFGARRALDATAGYIRFDVPDAEGRTGAGCWHRIVSPPVAAIPLLQARDAADGNMSSVILTATGTVLYAPGGVYENRAGRVSPSISGGPPRWVWVETWLTPGESNTTGVQEVIIRDENWNLLWEYTSPPDSNFGRTTPAAHFRMGGVSGTQSGWSYHDIDEVQFGSQAEGYFEAIANPPSAEWTQGSTRLIDFSASSDTSEIEFVSQTGPTVDVTVSGLVAFFVDSPSRLLPVTLTFDVTGPGGTTRASVVVEASSAHNNNPRIWDPAVGGWM